MQIMACVATWSFGLEAVSSAEVSIKEGKSCLDALEKAVNVVEDDPSTGPFYVGKGCYPNYEGVVQLDAAIMRGSDHSFGAVAALERYPKPISVARSVLELPSVNMLVGSGATDFAAKQGFCMEDNHLLLSEMTIKAYEEYKTNKVEPPRTGHDTLSVLCLDKCGHLAAGVSTSGPPFKTPGRVGDSPLPGCGLYADDMAGAAAGMRLLLCSSAKFLGKCIVQAVSGDGERIMQFCPSFQIVQLMREGLTAQEASDIVVEKMLRQSGRWFEVAVIALDIKGSVGAASTVNEWNDFKEQKKYSGFPYAHWSLHSGPPIISLKHAHCLLE